MDRAGPRNSSVGPDATVPGHGCQPPAGSDGIVTRLLYSTALRTGLGVLTSIGLSTALMVVFAVASMQSAFPEQQQGEISGLSRSVSNLGSSFGVNGLSVALMVVVFASTGGLTGGEEGLG